MSNQKPEIRRAIKLITCCFPKLFEDSVLAKKIETLPYLLDDLTDEEVRIGARLFAQNILEVYPNTNIAGYIRKYAKKESILSDYEAWSIVKDKINHEFQEAYRSLNGCYLKPKFENNDIDQAVDSIGWETICERTDQTGVRNDFFKIYNQIIGKIV